MLLLLGLACAAARAAPTSLRVFNDEGLEPAPANGTTPPVSINTDGQFVANDITIREAVSLWFSDRAAAEATYGHISTWATGGVTDMNYMFCVRDDWMDVRTDTSIVEIFSCGFVKEGNPFTNIDLIKWFGDYCILPSSAATFNEDLSAWDTSAVTDMYAMFYRASAFNQPLGGWRVDKVTSMSEMFAFASSFNHPLDDWRVDKVTYLLGMFWGAEAFNQPLASWSLRVGSVMSMSAMFHGASSFNQPLSGWRVEKVTSMGRMFEGASSFNQPLNDWQVDGVMDMSLMFAGASSFDQPLNDWRVNNVKEMGGMFRRASAFNQPLNDWRVDKVTSMNAMFEFASSFNQPLDRWNINKVTLSTRIFSDASAFNQDLGWCVDERVETSDDAFIGTKCASTNCGVSYPCKKRSKNKSAKRTKKERNGAIIIASVLFACLLLLGCALGSYRRRQKQLELERSEIVQEQVTAARDQIQEFQAHFVTISGSRFLAFDRLRPHEECRDELIIYDLVTDVRDASTRGEVFIFFSHQWLGWSEPDPKRIHVKAMQQAVRAVSTDTDTPLEKIRVWVDYVSIPQKNLRERALAIASLPTFASVSD